MLAVVINNLKNNVDINKQNGLKLAMNTFRLYNRSFLTITETLILEQLSNWSVREEGEDREEDKLPH